MVLPKDTPQSKTAQHVNTLEAVVIPVTTPLQNPSVESTSDSITISWNENNGTTLVLLYNAQNFSEHQFLATTDTTVTFENLNPDTRYGIQAFVSEYPADAIHLFESTSLS